LSSCVCISVPLSDAAEVIKRFLAPAFSCCTFNVGNYGEAFPHINTRFSVGKYTSQIAPPFSMGPPCRNSTRNDLSGRRLSGHHFLLPRKADRAGPREISRERSPLPLPLCCATVPPGAAWRIDLSDKLL